MADDTTDVSEHTQMVIVLRYVLNEEIFERFWGFFIPENQTADGISKCILEQLDIILQGNRQKLIAQTFDGANVMKGKKGGVQAKIKAVYNNAHFIHCYAHQLNLIMRNAASITRDSRIFFSNVLAIPTFFSRSPQRVSILNKHMNVSIPRPSSTRWNFNIRTVNKVHENLQPLKSCLAEIQSTVNADRTISEATGILHYLNNEKSMFWLELFHQIMPHVEVIYNQMQSREIMCLKLRENGGLRRPETMRNRTPQMGDSNKEVLKNKKNKYEIILQIPGKILCHALLDQKFLKIMKIPQKWNRSLGFPSQRGSHVAATLDPPKEMLKLHSRMVANVDDEEAADLCKKFLEEISREVKV
ncbi:zinc finger MYM-type protein 1-like [Homarus americanus]|uniref:zinc finger MYM-type protein 1-like n=1 Tax=Homarus americanus TaxID=6706 RepID=UPI001C4551A7|nr:zinc finger MYM-type protein 1-like [Homarus americanus]